MFYLDYNKLKYYTHDYIIRNKTRNYYNYCFILYYRYGYFNHSLS